jgi:hypothetical protein
VRTKVAIFLVVYFALFSATRIYGTGRQDVTQEAPANGQRPDTPVGFGVRFRQSSFPLLFQKIAAGLLSFSKKMAVLQALYTLRV